MWFLQSLACGFLVWFVLFIVTWIIALCKKWDDDACTTIGTFNYLIAFCATLLYASIKLLFYS